MYIWILLLPLLSAILSGLLGRFLGRKGSSYVSIAGIFLTCLLSVFIFYEVCLCKCVVYISLYNWIVIDLYNINIGFLFDSLTSTMIIVVSFISFFVHLYALGYMSGDPYLVRFMTYLSLFTFFMLVLVTSNNFLQMFIGWEGVGLASYLLINFWFTRILANKAALKAMIMNRIADVFFIFAILIIFNTFKTTDYIIISQLVPLIVNDSIIFLGIDVNKLDLITFFLFIGAIGKSAQMGFHTWLADAMEGPTPVSALLHAATMVTAGVFLILRTSFVFEYCDNILFLLIIFGGFTAFFAGIVAIFQYDIKKIIAYSTCSQLGYMFFTCGLSNYSLAFFHLFNHAFFKALLFLSAGSLIHALFDEQDIRKMGNMWKYLPFTYICILIGSLSIMGFPFLTGFYSKDIILEFTYSRFIVDALFIYFLGLISAVFTAIYSIRAIYFVFLGLDTNISYIYSKKFEKNIVECYVSNMYISMLVLIIGSIFLGYFFHNLMISISNNFWVGSLYVLPKHFLLLDSDLVHPIIKNLPVILSLLSSFIAYIFLHYFTSYEGKNIFIIIFGFFYHAGGFNRIYNYSYLSIFKFSYVSVNKYLDKGLFEYFGPYGLYKFFRLMHKVIRDIWVTNILFNIFFMFLFMSLFILIFIFWLNIFFIALIANIGLLPIAIVIIYFLYDKDNLIIISV